MGLFKEFYLSAYVSVDADLITVEQLHNSHLGVSRFLVIIDWWSLLVYLQLMLWNWQQDEENDMLELYSSYSGWDWISGSVKMIFRVILFSKIQLVVYYQYCVLIGWATTRLCAYL